MLLLPRPALLVLLAVAAPLRAALPSPDADDGGIALPDGFRAVVFADNLVVKRRVEDEANNLRGAEKLRGLAVAPNGDVYAKGKLGRIWALRDTDGDGRADEIKEFGPAGGGTHIMFHDGWLYHSSRKAVYRYKFTPGELVPTGEMQTIVRDLPAERDHDAKAFAFDEDGRMLVEVGSPYNVYSDGDRGFGAKAKSDAEVTEFQKTYGGFWRFDANKLQQTQADGTRFATGHRHALALTWHPVSKQFFMVQMGRDNLNVVAPAHYDELDNAERVAEVMHLVREGANFGWPYSYWDPIKKAHMRAPEYGGDNRQRDNAPYDKPVVAFPGHWAPIQSALYTGTQFPAKYRNGIFVAFHGSWNRAPRSQAGYNVCFVVFDERGMPTGAYEIFADGFTGREEFTSPGDARYRPAGVAVGPDGSLYISETEKGRIWRVFYTGEKPAENAARRSTSRIPLQGAAAVGADTPGGKIYREVCAACHMPSGNGVPGMQPALLGSAVVAGDVKRLIQVILHGPAEVLPADREKYQVAMPPFATAYSDQEIASLVNYLRANFVSNAGRPVRPEQVAAARGK